jgi:hypothetical protein
MARSAKIRSIHIGVPVGMAYYYHPGGGRSPVQDLNIFYEEEAANRRNMGSDFTVYLSPPNWHTSLGSFKRTLNEGRPLFSTYPNTNADVRRWGSGVVFENEE